MLNPGVQHLTAVSILIERGVRKIDTLTALIREADNALYRAKRAGRNRVEG
jgi:PleD family two-component response regulator